MTTTEQRKQRQRQLRLHRSLHLGERQLARPDGSDSTSPTSCSACRSRRRSPTGRARTTLIGRTIGMFVQDDWRVRPNLTMQLGVRYDMLWPFIEENGQLVNLDVNGDFTAAAPVESGQRPATFSGSFPKSLVETDTNNISPKLALAWRAPVALHRPQQLRSQLQQRHLLGHRPSAGAAAAVRDDRHQHRRSEHRAADGERADRHSDHDVAQQLRHRQGLRARPGAAGRSSACSATSGARGRAASSTRTPAARTWTSCVRLTAMPTAAAHRRRAAVHLDDVGREIAS